jgi:2-polyprenyl-3-methyl-5-hydroxy-6-metoxy-1,4-benzoquinol methylase
MVFKFADNRNPKSLASRLRTRRHEWFRLLISNLPRPLKILDVGGTAAIWETIGFVNRFDIQISLLNIEPCEASYHNVLSLFGDARDMQQFRENEFDVVYSNSVIEHVGDLDDMRRMAQEVRRVGKNYFLQTPNRFFPMEPHFLFPLFQFLPSAVQISLVQNFRLGWVGRQVERELAKKAVESIRLLSWNEMHALFPDAKIQRETLLGLTKSLIAYKVEQAFNSDLTL